MNDKFSFTRLGRVLGFYLPAMLRYGLWTGIIETLLYGIMVIGVLNDSIMLPSTASNIFGYIVMYSGLIFLIYRDRTVALQLPASHAERYVAVLLITIVIIPLAVLVYFFFLECIAHICGLETSVYQYLFDNGKAMLQEANLGATMDDMIGFYSSWRAYPIVLVPILLVTYVSLASKRHRVVKAVVSPFIYNFAIGLVSGIIGVSKIVGKIKEGVDMKPDSDEIVTMTLNMLDFFVYVSIVASVVLLVMLWRKIGRIQV